MTTLLILLIALVGVMVLGLGLLVVGWRSPARPAMLLCMGVGVFLLVAGLAGIAGIVITWRFAGAMPH